MSASATSERAPCPPAVLKLVERFHEHLDAYKQQAYKETQVRREFIDPFFTALGWDVANRAGHAEAYKDVIHEDAIKVGGSTKAPDYCFRIGGVRKFFVEAKKPVVGVKDEPGPAYQLRRYAWSNKLPLSIVTDFEELAVYDCRIKPKPTDRPSTARVMYVTYDQYPERWGQIAAIFDKESILKGSFDKYAESTRRKRGTAEVDAEFLKEIEEWRELLARNIALRNPELLVRDLNFAVTRTIDRIIFLRMCEDRGVETYEQLRVLPNGANIYRRLVELFYRADERYNSGLFHFQLEKGRAEEPDELTPDLTIDDRVLKDIITRLYYPECPYEFSVLPAEILGHVYEQFLGKVIRLTKGHRAVVEEKPEVKKAGGVYYTPSYIVDYIVEHTVGKLLEGKTPDDVGPMLSRRQNRDRKGAAMIPNHDRKGAAMIPNHDREGAAMIPKRDRKGADNKTLRILDPACGSGSFLLGAYQYLLDWHLKWYTENDPEAWAKKKNPPIYRAGSSSQYRDSHGAADRNPDRQGGAKPIGNWRLTVAERKRILLNNIYGVDIDPQAVEVTKLSLLLKVLEGENQQTLENQLRLFHERALPDLGSNIKCGNSLIGPDFYDNQQLSLLDEEERYRINAFDWETEFPEVFTPGESQAPSRARKEAAILPPAPDHQPLPDGRGSDLSLPDGRGSDHPGGFDAVIGNPPYGYEIPKEQQTYFANTYQHQDYQLDWYLLFLERYQRLLKRHRGIVGVIVSNTWLQSVKLRSIRRYLTSHFRWLRILHLPVKVFAAVVDTHVIVFQDAPDGIRPDEQVVVDVRRGKEVCQLHVIPAQHISKNGDPINVVSPAKAQVLFRKIQTVADSLGEVCQVFNGVKPFEKGKGNPPQTAAVVREKPYVVEGARRDDTWSPLLRGSLIRRYANLWKQDYWIQYGPWLAAPRNPSIFEAREKIMVRQTADSIIATMVEQGFIARNNLHIILAKERAYDLRYVLGLMNSRLMDFVYLLMNPEKGEALAEVKKRHVELLPVCRLHPSKHPDDKKYGRMLHFVERMLSLHKELDAARTPVDKTAIGRQIDATDRQIDQLVYDLYGLTDEEIRIVEEATKR